MADVVILDSSALVALSIETDAHHSLASRISQQLVRERRQVWLPTDVFFETINIIGKKFGHHDAVAAANAIFALYFQFIDPDEPMIRTALSRFATQPRDVSLTDCLVMAFADAYRTAEIFGFDAVFQKNGYRLPDEAHGRKAA